MIFRSDEFDKCGIYCETNGIISLRCPEFIGLLLSNNGMYIILQYVRPNRWNTNAVTKTELRVENLKKFLYAAQNKITNNGAMTTKIFTGDKLTALYRIESHDITCRTNDGKYSNIAHRVNYMHDKKISRWHFDNYMLDNLKLRAKCLNDIKINFFV
jgi:hypothetical protein